MSNSCISIRASWRIGASSGERGHDASDDLVGCVGDVVPGHGQGAPVDGGQVGKALELALAFARTAMEPVPEAFDRHSPLWERAVDVVRRIAAFRGELAYRRESLGPKRPPDLHLEARH